MENKYVVKFSIYNPAITYEHREVYDSIVSQLQQITPICNQGRCKAAEITSGTNMQMEINELMKQVELFASGLVDITKKFFDQLYCSKEEYGSAIALSTTNVKLNMIERNLLERTCDVRWWALEKAFWECIELANNTRDEMNTAPLTLHQAHDCLQHSSDKSIRELASEIERMRQLLSQNSNAIANPSISNQALQMLTSAIQAIDSNEHHQLRTELQHIQSTITVLQKKIKWACTRLEDVRASYTLYRDLVIVDKQGTIIANANPDRRDAVLGLDVSEKTWCIQASNTYDGTKYYAQDFSSSQVEDVDSLIYATALRDAGREKGLPIGTMGIFFDFQGEAQLILNDYMPKDEYGIMDGWFSFFSNQDGRIIASNDEGMIPVGTLAEIPKAHRSINKNGAEHTSYCIFKGIQSLVASKKTEGFDEYAGLGWRSHLILPQATMFANTSRKHDFGLDASTLMESKLVPETNKETYREIVRYRRDIQRISLNGIILASKLGAEGASFVPTFNTITSTGDSTSGYIEKLLGEMAEDMLLQNLNALSNFSKQAIDLIDRNLFERAADVRWWSTDHAFWQALQSPSPAAYAEASKRLGIINGSYTMYRDLILADRSGRIVANSKTKSYAKLSHTNVSTQAWFKQGNRIAAAINYGVQDVCDSNLEDSNSSLIYCGGIIQDGKRKGRNIGTLGILFDWEALAIPILQDCLPRHHGCVVPDCAAFYLNNEHKIIATTNHKDFPLYSEIDTGHEKEIEPSESLSGILNHAGRKYIIGSSCTQGYREYGGLQWTAHVVRPID